MSHVETQFPYAIFSAVLTFFGFIIASVLLQAGESPAWIPVTVMAVIAGFAYYFASRSKLGNLDL
jgi:Na+/H+ antiporter NhaC